MPERQRKALFVCWIGLSLSVLVASVVMPAAAHEVEEHGADAIAVQALVDQLVAHGFENVAATTVGLEVFVTYENRIYRYDLRALRQVIRLVLPLAPPYETVTIVPRNQDVSIGAVTVQVSDYQQLISGVITGEDFAEALNVRANTRREDEILVDVPPQNRTMARVDFLAHPSVAFQFGNFSDPIESQFNLVPEIQSGLWRGGRLRAQLILPIQNELSPEGKYVRPGLVTVNHTHRLRGNILLGATAGYFTHDRYGLEVGARAYLLNGRFFAGGNVGYTGYLAYRRQTWLYDSIDIVTPTVTAGYRVLPRHDLTMQLTYGRFLFQDLGYRLDISRSFGESEISLFGILSDGSDNVGFTISIPFLGSRYRRPRRVRVRQPRTIGYAYRFKNLPLEGVSFETGFDLDRFDLGMDPDFIRNHLMESHGLEGKTFSP